jgi:hypothetical protein
MLNRDSLVFFSPLCMDTFTSTIRHSFSGVTAIDTPFFETLGFNIPVTLP